MCQCCWDVGGVGQKMHIVCVDSTASWEISWGWCCCVTSIDSWAVHLRLQAHVQREISWGWCCCVTFIDSWAVHLRLQAHVQRKRTDHHW